MRLPSFTPTTRSGSGRFAARALAWLLMLFLAGPAPSGAGDENQRALLERLADKIRVTEVKPSVKGGRGVRLLYYVPVELEVFWNFKTDFENDWLVTNKYIEAHRFVRRHGNTVITETKYTSGPEVFFRWETRLFPEAHIMRYTLLNPEECGQKFNHGWIRMERAGEMTRVQHVSYFDFTGAFFWAHLPGPWGMTGFLRYTARWEQETILRLQSDYRK